MSWCEKLAELELGRCHLYSTEVTWQVTTDATHSMSVEGPRLILGSSGQEQPPL